ncbi:hypothetical protein GCM10018785_15090 [Streptomyces longispororuber]|uniref:Uncharacterized protein n=1 Tax=Streptomyces longispororuber TaxID=68230 RepID=A0A918ZCR9_9ACTN|nr:hypothetical protein GCM10018785_15090 [Streptomyces longispororuber]
MDQVGQVAAVITRADKEETPDRMTPGAPVAIFRDAHHRIQGQRSRIFGGPFRVPDRSGARAPPGTPGPSGTRGVASPPSGPRAIHQSKRAGARAPPSRRLQIQQHRDHWGST